MQDVLITMAHLNVNATLVLKEMDIIVLISMNAQTIQIYAKTDSALIIPVHFDANAKWALCIRVKEMTNHVSVSYLLLCD